jgi:hypothetical protein
VIALIRYLDLDRLQTKVIQKVSSQFTASAGITIRRATVSGHHTFDPQTRAENQ